MLCPSVTRDQSPLKDRQATAFSLVEVTMALGIVSFGLLSVMGLMPVGLSTLRNAMDQTVEGQIVQKVSGRFLLTPFSKLQTDYAAGTNFYFDQEGEEVAQSNATYEVKAKKPTGAVYPGASEESTNSLCMIPVEVKRLGSSSAGNSFNVFIPNSGN